MKPHRLLTGIFGALVCLLSLTPHFTAHGQTEQPDARTSPDAQRVTLLGRIGGNVPAAVALPDGSILAAEGSSLLRLTPSPAQGEVLLADERVDLGHGPILDLALSSNFVVALTEQGIAVLAAQSSGALPLPVSFSSTGGQSLAVQNGLIALAARRAGLKVLRLDPAGTISALSSLDLPGSSLDVALTPDGAAAYVAADEAGVLRIDLADPAQPRLETAISQTAPAEAVALAGSLLVVGSRGRVLTVDPTAGQPIVGQFAPLTQGRRMVIQNDFAYIADAADGLKIIWLAAPDRPLQVYGEADHPASDVLIDGDTLYLAGAEGLRILNVGNRYRPLQIAALALPAPPLRLALAPDGRVFAALGEQGVAVIDSQNLAVPRLSRLIALDGPANAVLFDRGALYVAAGRAGLEVIDAARPGQESRLVTFPLPGSAADLALRGDALVVACGEGGLAGLDVTRPAAPIIGDVLPPDPGHAIGSLTISGKRGYAGQGDSFLVIDVSRAGRLVRLKKVISPAEMVAASDIYLYALSDNQIGIFDARATAEPVALRAYRGLSAIAHLTVDGSRAYATSLADGPDAVALDLQQPDAPYELDNVGETGHTGRSALASGGVILPAGFAGLRFFSLTEGGALNPQAAYDSPPDISLLAADQTHLIAGGRSGWSALDWPSLARAGGKSDPDVRAVAVDGDTLVVASGDSSLKVYSLADSARPRLLAQREAPGQPAGLAVSTSGIFASGNGGLTVYDRNTLSAIRRIATHAPATGVAVRGNLAYVALDDGSLLVIDLGDLSGGIRVIGSLAARPVDLISAPNGSIFTLSDNVLSKLILSDPANPALVNQALLPNPAERGAFVNGLFVTLAPVEAITLYPAAHLSGEVVDFNSIETPASDLAPGWPISYAAYGESGWGIIDLASLSAGALISRAPARALYQEGNILFVLGDTLTAWNVDHAAQPEPVAALPLAGAGRHIDPAPGGNLLLSLDSGLMVAHWDGVTLTEVGALLTPGPLDRAAQVGNRAYLALHEGGLLVADLSDPAQPAALFSTASLHGQFVNDLLAVDDSRLLVSWDQGIDLLDVSGQARPPVVVASVPVGRSQPVRLTLSPDGARGAMAFADGTLAVIDLADPRHPAVVGQASLPAGGVPGGLALTGQTLVAADGLCGLRVFGLSGSSLSETGYWRGAAAADVVALPNATDRVTLLAANGSEVAALSYDPSGPAASPPVAQSPDPPIDQGSVPLNVTLAWGPPPDPCEPLTYAVYFGQEADPPLLGSVTGAPRLQLPDLDPMRAYTWRVDATDRQGDTVRGPDWHFTTVTANFPGVIPPSPPAFLAWVEDHPEVSAAIGALLAGLIAFALLRLAGSRRREPAPPPSPDPRDVPEWYSTRDDDKP